MRKGRGRKPDIFPHKWLQGLINEARKSIPAIEKDLKPPIPEKRKGGAKFLKSKNDRDDIERDPILLREAKGRKVLDDPPVKLPKGFVRTPGTGG
jgi:hypothetical protein